MKPSAKAAQQIVSAILHGDEKHQAWLKHFAPQMETIISQALSDSLRPYRELAEKWRKEALCISYPDALTRAAGELEALISDQEKSK